MLCVSPTLIEEDASSATYPVLAVVSICYPGHTWADYLRVTHPFATKFQ